MDLRKRFIWFTSSSAIGQLLTLISMIVITHLLKPEEAGVFYFVLAVSTILLPFCVLRMDSEIASQDNEIDKKTSFMHSLIIGIFLCSIICFIVSVILFFLEMFTWRNACTLFAIWIVTVIQVFSTLLIALGLYNREVILVSASSIFQNLTSSTLQILLVAAIPSSFSMLVGYVFGRLVALKQLLLAARLKIQELSEIRLELTNSLLTRRHLIIPGALDAVILTVPLIFIMKSGGLDSMGKFGFAQSLILAPVTLISGALYSTLFTQRAVRVEERVLELTDEYRECINLVVRLIPAVLAIFCFEFIGGEILFRFILSHDWKNGEYIFFQLLAPIMLQILAIPMIVFHWKNSLWKQYSRIVFCALMFSACSLGAAIFFLHLPLITCIGIYHLVKNLFLISTLIYSARIHIRNTQKGSY